jgi:hypothetical protein
MNNLFDDLPLPVKKPTKREAMVDGQGNCFHVWEHTTTVWPGENFERLTETCARCGKVRGRV